MNENIFMTDDVFYYMELRALGYPIRVDAILLTFRFFTV
jgi:hypothetical protein